MGTTLLALKSPPPPNLRRWAKFVAFSKESVRIVHHKTHEETTASSKAKTEDSIQHDNTQSNSQLDYTHSDTPKRENQLHSGVGRTGRKKCTPELPLPGLAHRTGWWKLNLFVVTVLLGSLRVVSCLRQQKPELS